MKFNDRLEGLKRTPRYWEAAARDEYNSHLLTAAMGVDLAKLGIKHDVDRALNEGVSLSTMCRIAYALGYRVRIGMELIDKDNYVPIKQEGKE